MKSAIAISYELDDIGATVRELTAQVRRGLVFTDHTVAILYGQPDMEVDELSYALSLELGCHVFGGTMTAGACITNEGDHESAVVLHVLTDNNCLFAPAISDSIKNDPAAKIAETYCEAYRNLKEQDTGAEPKLVICVTSILENIDPDDILSNISELCGNIPVFGFNAADDFDLRKQQIYLDGITGSDKLVILLISGDTCPIFQIANLAGFMRVLRK